MIANYHTHTRWCRHATGEIEDYIQEAVRKGLRAVAITEHVPHSQNFDPRRMQWEEFPAYNAELDRLIEKYRIRSMSSRDSSASTIPSPWKTTRCSGISTAINC